MRKSKEIEIPSQLFHQLAEHSVSVTEDHIFQNVKSENGQVTYRVIVFDDQKFEELMDYCEASTQFVPLNFEQYKGHDKGIKEFKDLSVHFMKPLKYYGIFGVSFMYRMVSAEGHLLFWITEKKLDVKNGTIMTINGRVKKEIDYHKGGIINCVNYIRVKE